MRIRLSEKEIAAKILTQGSFWGYEKKYSKEYILFTGICDSYKGKIFSFDVANRQVFHEECWIEVPDDKPFPCFGGEYSEKEYHDSKNKCSENSLFICILKRLLKSYARN